MARSLVQAAVVTGEGPYMEAVRAMADIVRAQLRGELEGDEEGGTAWAASKLQGGLSDALEKHRLATGDDEFDDLIDALGSPYSRFLFFGEKDDLAAALKDAAAAFSHNQAAFTSEVRFTDRVLKFTARYANTYADPPIENPRPSLLYETLTGDVVDPLYMPLPGVRWNTSPRDIALLVSTNLPEAFSAELFGFGESEREMGARLLRFQGEAAWSLECPSSRQEGITAQGLATFLLPPGEACLLTASPE